MAADRREPCIVMGVCFAPALAYMLNLSPGFRRRYRTKSVATDYATATLSVERFSDEDFQNTRLLIYTAADWADWGNEAGYAAVLARFPAGMERISYPYPTFAALWPMHCTDPRNESFEKLVRTQSQSDVALGDEEPERILDAGSPRGNVPRRYFPCSGIIGEPQSTGPDGVPVYTVHGDAYVLGMQRRGVAKADIIASYLKLDLQAEVDLDDLLLHSYRYARRKELTCDVKVVELIYEQFRHERYFVTVNHPSNRLLVVIANQILAKLGFPELGDYPLRSLSELLGVPSIPIHPGVIRHFGLRFANASTRYPFLGKRMLTFDEYLDQYIDFVAAPMLASELAVHAERDKERLALTAICWALGDRLKETIGEVVPAAESDDELRDIALRAWAWIDAGGLATINPYPGWAGPSTAESDGFQLSSVVNVRRGQKPIGFLKTTLKTGSAPKVEWGYGPFEIPATWELLSPPADANG